MQEALPFGPAQIVMENLGEVKHGSLEPYKVRILFKDSVNSLCECESLTAMEASGIVSSLLDSAESVVHLSQPPQSRYAPPESNEEKKQKADEDRMLVRYALGKTETALGVVFHRNPNAVTRDVVNRIVDFGCSGVGNRFYGNEEAEAPFPFLRKAIAARPVALTYALERAVALKIEGQSTKKARRHAQLFLHSAKQTLGHGYKPLPVAPMAFPSRKPESMLRYLP